MRTLLLCLILFASTACAQYVALRHSTPAGGPVTWANAYSANVKAGDGTGDTVDVQVTVPSQSNMIAVAGVGLRYTYGSDVLDVRNVTDGVAFARAEVRDAEHHGSIWYQTGITPGTKTFRLTADGSNYITLWVAIYSNAAQTNPIRDSAFASGNGTGPTVNINSNTDDLVVDHLYINNGAWTPATTAGAGQTERFDYHEGENPVGQVSSSTEAGAASVTMSWTIEDSFEYTLIAVSIKRAN